jgi:hypothetical protein
MDNPASNLGSGNRGTLINLVAIELSLKEATNARGTTSTREVPGSNPGGPILHGAVAQSVERANLFHNFLSSLLIRGLLRVLN